MLGPVMNINNNKNSTITSHANIDSSYTQSIQNTLLRHSNFYQWSINLSDQKIDLPSYARTELGLAQNADILVGAFESLIHPDDLSAFKQALLSLPSQEQAPHHLQYRMINLQTKAVIWYKATLIGIFDTKGYLRGLCGTHFNITAEKAAFEKLEENNKSMAQLLANMSHEIRTSLSGVLGIIEVLEQFDHVAEEEKYIGILKRTTKSLVRIVNDILDHSKIEFGGVDLIETPFNIRFCIDDVCALFTPIAAKNDVKILQNINAETPEIIIGDEGRIRQILINIIGNAVKFTHEGQIIIDVDSQTENENCTLSISITDTGEGIPDHEVDHIFESFKQANSHQTAQKNGTGLGLKITKELVALMGGDIKVKSQIGTGTQFTFTLQLRYEGKSQLNSTSDNKKHDALSDLVPEKLNSTTDNMNHTADHKVDLLVAEDNEANQMYITYVLKELGVDFALAKDGQEAVKQWEALNPKAILMDVSMPHLDGHEATMLIRKMEKEQSLMETPIIALTANTIRGDKEKCLAAGMNEYLTKPIAINGIKDFLNKWIEPDVLEASQKKIA